MTTIDKLTETFERIAPDLGPATRWELAIALTQHIDGNPNRVKFVADLMGAEITTPLDWRTSVAIYLDIWTTGDSAHYNDNITTVALQQVTGLQLTPGRDVWTSPEGHVVALLDDYMTFTTADGVQSRSPVAADRVPAWLEFNGLIARMPVAV